MYNNKIIKQYVTQVLSLIKEINVENLDKKK